MSVGITSSTNKLDSLDKMTRVEFQQRVVVVRESVPDDVRRTLIASARLVKKLLPKDWEKLVNEDRKD